MTQTLSPTEALDAAPAHAREAAPPAPVAKPRSKARVVSSASIAATLVLSASWFAWSHGKERTDDAQIEGHIVSVSARVPGQIARVLVKDNQRVQAGEVIAELDDDELTARLAVARADVEATRAAVDTAETQLEITRRNTNATLRQAKGAMTQAGSTVTGAQALLAQAHADVVAAEARYKLAELQLVRSKNLHAEGSLAQADVDMRQNEDDAARASLDLARAHAANARAQIGSSAGGLELARGRVDAADTAPQQVASAEAALAAARAKNQQADAAARIAELNLGYAKIKAPVTGTIARRTVEPGQMVSPDRALLAVVATEDVWVVANFKEDQIGDMKAGQAASITIDTYGRRDFVAHVESIAGGSGARFALLPPDNATGNFIKVVQRVPVLLRFDGASDVALRPGLSAEVTVRTR